MGFAKKQEEADKEKMSVLRPVTPGLRQEPDVENEIDLLELGYVLLDKIHFILLWFLIGAILLNAYAFFCIRPTYQSTAKMYVVSASNDSVVDLTDLNIGTSLTADYEQLMLSYPVLDQVIEELNLDMETEDLAEMVTLENPADTRILNVTVTSTDPVEAKDIANKIITGNHEYESAEHRTKSATGGYKGSAKLW